MVHFAGHLPRIIRSSEHSLQREPSLSLTPRAGTAEMHSEYTLNGHLGPGNDKSAVAAAFLRMKGNDTNGDGGREAE